MFFYTQESMKEERGKIKNRKADISGCSSVLRTRGGGTRRGKVRRFYMSSDLQSVMVDHEVAIYFFCFSVDYWSKARSLC